MIAGGSLDFGVEDGGSGFLPDETVLLRRWLETSSTWADWVRVESPLLRRLTMCWETYLDRARPSLILMANQWGIEGWFTRVARRRGIPVVQAMHGVLGGYLYTQTPVLSDILVTFGEFWRLLWPMEEQGKIVVYNPPGYPPHPPSRGLPRMRLTYFSWPLSLLSEYNFHEFTDAFVDMFLRLIEVHGCTITIRAHPLEDLTELAQRWTSRRGPIPPMVKFSKEEPLDQILAATDVALMFRSTVMLNCIAAGIPVVMPGWIDYGWNKALEEVRCVSLARDFADLQERLSARLSAWHSDDSNGASHFVRHSDEGREKFVSTMRHLSKAGATARTH